jgi:hypothetical protein
MGFCQQVRVRPTKRSQDTERVLSGKRMGRHPDWVHWMLGILAVKMGYRHLVVGSGLEVGLHPAQKQVRPGVLGG